MFKGLDGRLKRPQWQSLARVAIAAGAIFFIFFWRLAGLTAGLSASEVSARQSSFNLHAIVHNPVNAPHKLVQLLFEKLLPNHMFWLRLPSVIFALIFVFCFYKLAVKWFGKAIGLFSTLIFTTLPLFVVTGRQASAEIMYFGVIVLMWLYVWLLKAQKAKAWAWLSLVLAAAMLLYTPGVVWWVLGAFVVSRKRLTASVKQVPVWASTLGLLALAAAAGSLAMVSAHDHSIARQLLLLPASFAPVTTLLKNTAWMFLALFLKTPAQNSLIIARLPLLDILTLALLVFGIYALAGAARNKAAAFGLSIVLGITAAGINNNLALLAFGLPAVGLFIAAGLRYLYIEWRSIFPRNPVPKTFALILIAIVTLSQLYFGLRYSLEAWPHSQTARSAYVLK